MKVVKMNGLKPEIVELDYKVIKEEMERTNTDYRMLILPDHPTPIKLKTHTSDPVPYIIYDSTSSDVKSGYSYTEDNAKKTGVYIEEGYTLMDKFLQK